MRWPFRRTPACASDDATASAEQAKRALQESKAQHAKAEQLGEQLAEVRRRNHFGEAVAWSMRRA